MLYAVRVQIVSVHKCVLPYEIWENAVYACMHVQCTCVPFEVWLQEGRSVHDRHAGTARQLGNLGDTEYSAQGVKNILKRGREG